VSPAISAYVFIKDQSINHSIKSGGLWCC